MYRFEQLTRLTTPAVLAAVAASYPDRSFVVAEDGELTYGMMAEQAARLAGQFTALGLRPGERNGPGCGRSSPRTRYSGSRPAGMRTRSASASGRDSTWARCGGSPARRGRPDCPIRRWKRRVRWRYCGTRRRASPTTRCSSSPAGARLSHKAVRLTQGGLVRRARPGLARFDISPLRTGTANATPADLRLAIEVLGVRQVCNAYAMTEGHGHSTITTWDDPVDVRTGSQGRVLPTQELRIMVNGAVAGTDEIGEIQIRNAITPGYLALIRDVRDWMAGRAAAIKTPTAVRVVTADELPLTATGKVSKRLLQEAAQSDGMMVRR